MFLKQSTSQVVRFGPFLDSSDGVSAETGLTIAQADMQLSKDGGAFAQKNASGNATHDTDGWYSTTLNATDTNTVGELVLQVVVAGALPVWLRWYVVEESIYDSLFGASADGFDSNQRVNVGRVLGTAQTAGDVTAIANAIETDTQDIQGRLPTALVSGRMSSDAVAISGSTAAADSVEANIGNLNATVSSRSSHSAADVWTSGTRTLTSLKDVAKEIGLILTEATISAVTSQTQLVLPTSDDATDDDAYNGHIVVLIDGTDPNQRSVRVVTDYDATTRTVTIDRAADFTVTTSDSIVILPSINVAIQELAQAAPAAEPSLLNAVMLLYMALRNQVIVNTSGTPDFMQIHNDAGTIIAKKQLTDDGSDYTEAEMVTGP